MAPLTGKRVPAVPVRKQEPPFAIQVELVEGCNLRCTFCGLNGIRAVGEKNYKMMTVETARAIGETAHKWNSRIELAMHGEPTMHKDFCAIIRVLRFHAPNCQIMMTTNGGGLLPQPTLKILDAFFAGLNVLALDEYEGIKIGTKVRAIQHELEAHSTQVKFREYPEDASASPHRRFKKSELPLVVYIADPSVKTSARTPHLNNHAGAGAPLNDSQQGKRCAKPFREVSVRWDGSVAICCNDWRGVYKCGNVNVEGLEAIWSNAAFDAARRKLYYGERDFGPCKGCDATSHRVGLLPDPLGKAALHPVDSAAAKAMHDAMSGDPYTKPVLRPWEPGYTNTPKEK